MRINIIDNTVQEPNETFNVTLQLRTSCLPVNLAVEQPFTITIIDDEGQLIFLIICYILICNCMNIELIVEFSKVTYSGRETSGVITVTLNLLGGTASINFSVNILTSPVTATGE